MMTTFAKQLKTYRQARQLSQEALAKQLSISRQSISKWENNEATPDLDNLVKLADVLEVSLDELVKGEKQVVTQSEKDDDDLDLGLLKGREYVINPETGVYEKRDGFSLAIALFSEYWWFLLALIPWLSIFF